MHIISSISYSTYGIVPNLFAPKKVNTYNLPLKSNELYCKTMLLHVALPIPGNPNSPTKNIEIWNVIVHYAMDNKEKLFGWIL